MPRFIIEEISKNNYLLYDCQMYGLPTLECGNTTQETIIFKNGKYYIRYWVYGGGYEKDLVTKTKLKIIETFDTIEQVKEKYTIEEKQDDWFDMKGYLTCVRAIKKS